jgi:hypothetical protein
MTAGGVIPREALAKVHRACAAASTDVCLRSGPKPSTALGPAATAASLA